jgi:hypothetical protein
MAAPYNILILGASYGSLLASKLLFGGHSVKLVCLPAEADLINAEGFRVRLPVRGRAISSASPCRSRNIARPACASPSMPSGVRRCRACRS